MSKRGGTRNIGLNFGDFFQSIIGLFGFNTFTICKPEDDSLYCKITQYFQLIIIVFVIIGIIYFAFKFLLPSFTRKGGKYNFKALGKGIKK